MSQHKGSLTPAYGRDYNTRDAALADWNAGKDFKLHNHEYGGVYCSKRDFPEVGTKFQLRWNRMTEIDVITNVDGENWSGTEDFEPMEEL